MAVDRDALIARLAKAKRVSVDGLTKDERSVDELLRAIDFADNETAAADIVDKTGSPTRYQFYKPPGPNT